MRTSVLSRVAASAAVSLAIPAAALGQTQVETFSYTVTIDANMPGTPSGGSVDFSGSASITSLDFAPGSVVFQGQPVDFDGTEANFLAGSYTGTVNIPVSSGPTVTNASGTMNVTGAVTGVVDVEIVDLDLGPAFSNNQLDVVHSQPYDSNDRLEGWSSVVVPELNGANVTTNQTSTVVACDPINGIVDTSGSGAIFAKVPAVPALTTWGLFALLTGLVGFFAVFVGRVRRERSPA